MHTSDQRLASAGVPHTVFHVKHRGYEPSRRR